MTSTIRIVRMALVLVLTSVAAAFVYAQARPDVNPVRPMVISGEDVGFRVEGRKGAAVVGRFVVRIDGKWVEVDNAFATKVITTGR